MSLRNHHQRRGESRASTSLCSCRALPEIDAHVATALRGMRRDRLVICRPFRLLQQSVVETQVTSRSHSSHIASKLQGRTSPPAKPANFHRETSLPRDAALVETPTASSQRLQQSAYSAAERAAVNLQLSNTLR